MSALDLPEAGPGTLEDSLVEVGRYATNADAAARGLVVLASGHPYWLMETSDGIRLMVERAAALVAGEHLAAYERESARWPPPPIADHWTPGKTAIISPLVWAVAVLAIFHATGTWPGWLKSGALDAQAIFEGGEWWRPATALFLHADAPHVTSNALSGLLVFSAVLSTIGRLRGWGLLLLSSIAGNLAVAAVNFPDRYVSVGASTAIFAGIGLLTGRAIRVAWRSTHPYRWRAMFVPLAAGLTVLALHGAGGQRVDVGAHLAGFLAGLVFGFAAGVPRSIGRR